MAGKRRKDRDAGAAIREKRLQRPDFALFETHGSELLDWPFETDIAAARVRGPLHTTWTAFGVALALRRAARAMMERPRHTNFTRAGLALASQVKDLR